MKIELTLNNNTSKYVTFIGDDKIVVITPDKNRALDVSIDSAFEIIPYIMNSFEHILNTSEINYLNIRLVK